MVLHRTGPGRVTIDTRFALPGGVRALLSNFDIDGDTLKREYTDFLDTQVVPLLVGQNAHIWLQGSASHSGSDRHNMGLSQRRVNNVVAYLRSRGVQDNQMQPNAVGESMAVPGVNEDQRDRAVALLVARTHRPPPPPPQPPVVPARTSTVFRIRMLGGLSAGAFGLQADQLYFQIWDHVHGLTCFYQFTGGGAGRSFRLPFSVTLQGRWNDMRTTRPLQVTEFGGPAQFSSAGAGPLTWNYLDMTHLPRRITTVPEPMRINTGFTIGAGLGTVIGTMILFNNPAWPFTGP